MCLQACKCAKWLTVFSLLTSSFCARCSMQFRERLEHKFWWSAYIVLWIFHAVPVDLCWLSLLFLFLSLWSKRQQRLNSFFTQKRIAVEPEKHEDEAGEVNSLSQPPELQEPTMMSVVKNSKIIVWPRPFMKWPNLKRHDILQYFSKQGYLPQN